MANTHIGLEITEESVRAVEITAGRNPVLLARGEVPLPPGAAKDSEVLDVDAVAMALRQLWTRAGIKGRRVVLGIGNRRILVREYSTEVMRADLLRQALPYQVQDLLPVPVEQAVLDFYPATQTDDRVSGLLVAAVSETVEQLIAAATKAKLTVERVDLAPFGLARVAHTIAPGGEPVGMIHVGDHTTYVVVAAAGVPRFVRIIALDLPTAAVRERSPETVPAVEPDDEGGVFAPALRSRFGRGASLEPAVRDLVERLNSTISFYRDRRSSEPVTAVHLSGAGIAVPGMMAALTSELPSQLTPLRLSDVIASKQPFEPDGDHDLNFVTTIGVVLGEGRS